jgi:hypothetical protein
MSSNIVLKTLSVKSIPEIIEDLNTNFSQLYSLISIKGRQGLPGSPGDLGSPGKRGAQFTFLNLDDFAENFAIPANADEIDIDLINNAISENSALFFDKCVNSNDIVHLDYLVLPNGVVLQYNAATNNYESTYLKLYKAIDQLTQEQIIQLILQYSSAASSVQSVYSSIHKIVADDNPNAEVLNSTLTSNSIADISTSNSGTGYTAPNLIFVALQESIGVYGDDDTKAQIANVFGHAKDYHTLLQNTLAANKLSSAPKINNSPTLIAIQNLAASGMILGSKDSATLENFAHIRKNGDALEIMPYYVNDSSYIAANSIISISNALFKVASTNVSMHAKTSLSLFANNVESIKITAASIDLKHNLTFSKLATNQTNLVSIQANTGDAFVTQLKTTGAVVQNGNAVVIESLLYNFTESFVNNRLGISNSLTVAQYISNIVTPLAQQLNTLTQQVNAQSQTIATLTAKLAIFVKDGVIFPWRKPASQIPEGFKEVTDFAGKTLVGLDPTDTDFDTIGKLFGSKTHKLKVAEMPQHSFYTAVPSSQQSYPQLNANNSITTISNYGNDGNYVLGASIATPTVGKTNMLGGNVEHNNVQPSKVVMFIEWNPS